MPQAVEVSMDLGHLAESPGMEANMGKGSFAGLASPRPGGRRNDPAQDMFSGFPDGFCGSQAAPLEAQGDLVPTGHVLADVLLPQVRPALRAGLSQSVAAALLAATELLGIADDLRQQLAATLPRGQAAPVSALRPSADAAAAAEADALESLLSSWQPARASATRRRAEPYAAAQGPGGSLEELQLQIQGGPYEGVVKSLHDKGGANMIYGFLACQDTFAIYGRDVYLHSTQAVELGEGDRVSFHVALNVKGMPQAHNVSKIM